MRFYKTFLYLLITLFFFSSHLYGQPLGWQGKTEIESNIQYIYNPKQGLWDNDSSKKFMLEKQFSIGYYKGPEDYLFTMVKEVIVDRVGRIIVLDLYDKNGYFLKSYPYDNDKYGKIKFVDAEGYLYTGIGPSEIVPGVTKWRISFE
jgi:hypothetical protein